MEYLFMIKTFSKLGIAGQFLNLIKGIYDKPTTHITLNGKKTENFPPEIRNKIRITTFLITIQHCPRCPG